MSHLKSICAAIAVCLFAAIASAEEAAVVERDLTLGYSAAFFGLAIPFKHGPFLAWRTSDRWAFEAGYFGGSISIDTPLISVGSVTESLLTLNARRFSHESSFNWIIGISRQSYGATLGRDLIINGGIPTSYDMVLIKTVGLQLGLGNRWSRPNGLTFGCDWFVMNIPFMTIQNEAPALSYVTDSGIRTRIEDSIKILRYVPTFAIAKLNLGYSF